MAVVRLGWKKDKYDNRDWLHKLVPKLPQKVVLDRWLADVRDQGNIGSCVGFAMAANLIAWAKAQGVYTEWFSPTWIYNGARFIEGTLASDDGCYPRNALDWLLEKGGLLEKFWPYDPYRLDTSPPPSRLDVEAAKYPLLSYRRVTEGVTGICSAISCGYYVAIGTPWFEHWMEIAQDGLLLDPEHGVIIGGHATCLYGYDIDAKLFYGINSWGTYWGRNGLFLMPFDAFDVFRENGGYDAHYISVQWGEDQPKPPEPEDGTCGIANGICRACNALAGLMGRKHRLKSYVAQDR